MKPEPNFRPLRLLPLLVTLFAAACSHLPGNEPTPSADYWLKHLPAANRSPAPGRAESLLIYYEYVRSLSASELVRENEQMKQLAATDKSDFTRIRHALLLAHQPPGSRDHLRAQQLLEPIRDAKTTDPALRAFAALLVSDLIERRRLEESLQSATQRQKDEQARAADLQQKLDALKAIEKSIAERRPAASAPAGKTAVPRR